MSKDSVTNKVLEFVQNKDEITASEIAAFIITLAREDLAIAEPQYQAAELGKSVLWRGATSYAKDIIKRPRVVEEILDEAIESEEPDEHQGELFEGLGAFVRVDKRDGAWRFKRRRALYRGEYLAAQDLLREKAGQLARKVERYDVEYDKALPFWREGLTFGEVVALASEQQP